MDESQKQLSRRGAIRSGALLMGAAVALKAGALPALANGETALAGIGGADAQSSDKGWEDVERALGGTKGMLEDDGVFKVDLPRTDIHATIFGIPVKPDFALDGEVTFKRTGQGTVMKFEVALLDREVNPVLKAWFAQNLKPETEIFTALHNHYLEDSPPIKFVHGFAVGDEVRLARALYKTLSENSGTPFGHGDEPPGNPGFDVKKVEEIIGGEGQLTNGVLTVSVPRKETIRQRGIALPPAMQFESMFNFQSIGGGQVATIAEFVVTKDEADPVCRELLRRGLLVTALHNHELDVQPDLYYVHSWGTGSPYDLARAIRAALNLTNSDFS